MPIAFSYQNEPGNKCRVLTLWLGICIKFLNRKNLADLSIALNNFNRINFKTQQFSKSSCHGHGEAM